MNASKRVATSKDPIIEAVIAGLFRFKTEYQALSMLKHIEEKFVISKDQEKDDGLLPTIKLWIKGYYLTETEKKEGYRGNYALFYIGRTTKKDLFTIRAKKLAVELKFHPQKEQVENQLPNWGHPILRAVKKGKIYPNQMVARAELMLLHEDYPEISVPGIGKLRIMVYHHKKDGGGAVDKIILVARKLEDGTAQIVVEEKKAVQRKSKKSKFAASASGEGYFTKLVEKQRQKRKPLS